MKKILLLFLLCLTGGGMLLAQVLKPFEIGQIHEEARMEKQMFERMKGVTAVDAIRDPYDVIHYRCRWKVDPAVKFIQGSVRVSFVARGNVDTVQLDLHDTLQVDSVLHHGQQVAFDHSGGHIRIPVPALSASDIDSVEVFYQGVPPSSGFGSFEQNVHDTLPEVPIIWTLSEPYGASEWWPCKNDLSDKADSIDLYLEVPDGNLGVSNGLIADQNSVSGWTTYHWKHRYPIATYLVCMAVTNYAVYPQQVTFGNNTMPLNNYLYPEDSADVVPQLQSIPELVTVFDSLFGLYPFAEEKYGQVQFGWGGGMEHQTATFAGNFSYHLLSHELGHQWFGDRVTCGSWEDIWLNEGFATYMTGLGYENMFNGQWWHPYIVAVMGDVTSAPDGSVRCTDTTDINRIFDGRLTYSKGAMILHQLRWVVGDSAFFQGIRNYLNDPSLGYGFARTSDLQSHIEASSGQNLDWYFNDWYDGEGYPSYDIGWSQTGNTLELVVNQQTSDASVSFFALPIPVKVYGAGSDTLLRLSHTYSGEIFQVPVSFKVDSIRFDPDVWIISASNHIASVPEINADEGMRVYPNPASHTVYVQLAKPAGHCNARLFDVSGRLIRSVTFEHTRSFAFPLPELAAGLYDLDVVVDGLHLRQKLVVD
ncbi:MAG: T9SS type A sorting domain-containing protein [Flavobacteriales bacterium]|nr:T9SS type A sorting domain-containing protein [Flavobacteriales bacterium]MCB9447222.1 T9SS type A sorting domain-containing protein [Flavobacteriales bacterium]